MKWMLLPLVLLSLSKSTRAYPPSPVIGILTQPTLNGTNYIAASYVKWLEAGGARSLPILYDETNTTKLADIFGQINGILLPGGASEMPTSVKFLLDRAKEYGCPVWGTCLGFEYLIQYIGGIDALQSGFEAENISLPLENVVPWRLYGDSVIQQIAQQDITMNNHHQGITLEQFQANAKLSSFWKVTSVSHDKMGRRFVSTIEPVGGNVGPQWYGVQFHPEKNTFEYGMFPHSNIPYEAIDHSAAGVQFSLHLARFFVNLARHWNEPGRYKKPDEYPLVNTYPMKRGFKFEQIYLLPAADKEEHPSIRSSLRQPTTQAVAQK